jgi:hypothetical protein
MIGINVYMNIRRAALKSNFELALQRLHQSEILMLPMGTKHVKQCKMEFWKTTVNLD